MNRFFPLSFLVASLLAGSSLSRADAPAPSAVNPAGATATRDWPSITLRGYGTVSGTSTQWTMPGGPASILQIHCDDADKARLVQAKYLADLAEFPGITQAAAAGPNDLAHVEIGGTSAVLAAARSGTDVFIFQASAKADLPALLAQHFTGDRTALVFTPQGDVPMYLDRWDKYGFRFYYQASTPKGQADAYDFSQDFTFAATTIRSGLVFWDPMAMTDSADGEMRIPAWAWTISAASDFQLPFAINDGVNYPLWLTNKYRNQTMLKAPGYVGGLGEAGQPETPAGTMSWSATTGADEMLSELQTSIRKFNPNPNLVSWLEPHGEIPLNPQNLVTDYGPAADAGFRKYLQDQYHDIATLNKRWYGDDPQLKSWDDVHVPELAYFRGGGSGSVDLAGTWRIGYETAPGGKAYTPEEIAGSRKGVLATDPAPEDWYQPSFDDSAWPQIVAPGHDIGMFVPKAPAVLRRTFDMDPGVMQKSSHWYLYVWDMNYAHPSKMWAYLNGSKVGESDVFDYHWAAFDVTNKLQSGSNQLSLRLPNGYIGYRVYLSPQPVRDYPDLGEQMNAQWVDFTQWNYLARIDMVRRGVEMIRQIDPNRNITFMHPDDYADGIKTIGEDFGGEFHCTGYMSAFYADSEPMEMRGADMPSSLEPGGPASKLEDFKRQMGLDFSEGVQGIDYFQRITDVMWKDDIRAQFIDTINMLHTVGKFHAPKAATALFIDDSIDDLTGYPWGAEPSVLLHSGYWSWNTGAGLKELFPIDALNESDFDRGNAAKYKVIIDTDTTIMSDKLLGDIEAYVRNGGIFITAAQTGRHSQTQMDSWPIERLTGYHVSHIDKVHGASVDETQPVEAAPDQDTFAGQDWNNGVQPNGLSLDKVAPECQDLMMWQDGKTAVGLRPLGKGFIVEVGVKFTGVKVGDHFEGKLPPGDAMWALLYQHLLDHFKVAHVPATLSEPDSPVLWRHYLSNNGLFDVWTMWNSSKIAPDTVSLSFAQGINPALCIEMTNNPAAVPVTKSDAGSSLDNLQFEPEQTRVFVTPRGDLVTAADDWFQLQRNWWRGTAPVRKQLPPFHNDNTLDLTADWAFQPLDAQSDVAAMSAPDFDDSKWTHRDLGCWGIGKDNPGVKRAMLRKKFTVPTGWSKGQTTLWMIVWAGAYSKDSHVYLDGKEIQPGRRGIAEEDGGGTLTPGSSHLLAVDVEDTGFLVGVSAPAWLSYLPDPSDMIDLSGEWKRSDDYLTFDKTMTFPGGWDGVAAQKIVPVDAKYAGKNLLVDFNGPVATAGVIVNGHWIGHEKLYGQERWQINVTPFIKFGVDNEIELVGAAANPRDNFNVASVKLDVYDPTVYP